MPQNIIDKIETPLGPIQTNGLSDFLGLVSGMGDQDKTVANAMYGMNHRRTDTTPTANKDKRGFVFFTKPQMNLTTPNVRNLRELLPLLSTNNADVYSFTRCTLDPRLQRKISAPKMAGEMTDANSLLVNSKNPFIPVMTNSAISCTGWPDKVLPTWTSPEGLRKEQISIVDGVPEILNGYDLDVTFDNMLSEPIIHLMDTWLTYTGAVFEGMMSPYMDMIVQTEIDYNTRVYNLTLDETGRYVKKIFCNGGSFPLNVPYGKYGDFDKRKSFNDGIKDFTIRFRSLGAIYNQDIVISWFNRTVNMFHSGMRALDAAEAAGKKPDGSVLKIPNNLLVPLNNRGYPRINPRTYELEWYIDANSKTLRSIHERMAI